MKMYRATYYGGVRKVFEGSSAIDAIRERRDLVRVEILFKGMWLELPGVLV